MFPALLYANALFANRVKRKGCYPSNIDLKGFRQKYYEKLGGSLETVKEFIIRVAADCHVELTTLIVPGENDEISEMEE